MEYAIIYYLITSSNAFRTTITVPIGEDIEEYIDKWFDENISNGEYWEFEDDNPCLVSPICNPILTNKVYTAKEFWAIVFPDKDVNFTTLNDIEYTEYLLDEEFGDGTYFTHCLSEISECKDTVVLVKFRVPNQDNGLFEDVYRWVEINKDYFAKEK